MKSAMMWWAWTWQTGWWDINPSREPAPLLMLSSKLWEDGRRRGRKALGGGLASLWCLWRVVLSERLFASCSANFVAPNLAQQIPQEQRNHTWSLGFARSTVTQWLRGPGVQPAAPCRRRWIEFLGLSSRVKWGWNWGVEPGGERTEQSMTHPGLWKARSC